MNKRRVGAARGVWVVLWVLTAVAWGALLQEPALSSSPLQSGLPTPPFVQTTEGGRIFCGPQQGPAWLDLPGGFTNETGAEVYCDPTASLAQTLGTTGAWNDRGYLLGVYPQATLVKPLAVVLEVDPAQTANVCATCFVGRAFNPDTRSWADLPTTYDGNNARVSIQVSAYPPAAGYPGFADRGLVALFTRAAPQPTPVPTQPATATTAPPTPTPTALPPTATPVPPTATPVTVVEPPTNTPTAGAVAVEVTQPAATPAATATSDTPASTGASAADNGTSWLLTGGLALLVVVLAVVVIVLARRVRRS